MKHCSFTWLTLLLSVALQTPVANRNDQFQKRSTRFSRHTPPIFYHVALKQERSQGNGRNWLLKPKSRNWDGDAACSAGVISSTTQAVDPTEQRPPEASMTRCQKHFPRRRTGKRPFPEWLREYTPHCKRPMGQASEAVLPSPDPKMLSFLNADEDEIGRAQTIKELWESLPVNAGHAGLLQSKEEQFPEDLLQEYLGRRDKRSGEKSSSKNNLWYEDLPVVVDLNDPFFLGAISAKRDEFNNFRPSYVLGEEFEPDNDNKHKLSRTQSGSSGRYHPKRTEGPIFERVAEKGDDTGRVLKEVEKYVSNWKHLKSHGYPETSLPIFNHLTLLSNHLGEAENSHDEEDWSSPEVKRTQQQHGVQSFTLMRRRRKRSIFRRFSLSRDDGHARSAKTSCSSLRALLSGQTTTNGDKIGDSCTPSTKRFFATLGQLTRQYNNQKSGPDPDPGRASNAAASASLRSKTMPDPMCPNDSNKASSPEKKDPILPKNFRTLQEVQTRRVAVVQHVPRSAPSQGKTQISNGLEKLPRDTNVKAPPSTGVVNKTITSTDYEEDYESNLPRAPGRSQAPFKQPEKQTEQKVANWPPRPANELPANFQYSSDKSQTQPAQGREKIPNWPPKPADQLQYNAQANSGVNFPPNPPVQSTGLGSVPKNGPYQGPSREPVVAEQPKVGEVNFQRPEHPDEKPPKHQEEFPPPHPIGLDVPPQLVQHFQGQIQVPGQIYPYGIGPNRLPPQRPPNEPVILGGESSRMPVPLADLKQMAEEDNQDVSNIVFKTPPTMRPDVKTPKPVPPQVAQVADIEDIVDEKIEQQNKIAEQKPVNWPPVAIGQTEVRETSSLPPTHRLTKPPLSTATARGFTLTRAIANTDSNQTTPFPGAAKVPVVDTPTDRFIMTGGRIVIVCPLSSAPSPDEIIKWKNPDGSDITDTRFKVKPSGEMIIEDTEIEDSGNYTCIRVTQNVETSTETVHLYVYVPAEYILVMSYEIRAPDCADETIETAKRIVHEEVAEKVCFASSTRQCIVKSVTVACVATLRRRNDRTVLTRSDGEERLDVLVELKPTPYFPPDCDLLCNSKLQTQQLVHMRAAAERYVLESSTEKRQSALSVRPIKGSESFDVTTSCRPGFHVDEGVCLPCPPGSYSPGDGMACVGCPLNTYQARSGGVSCSACPDGGRTLKTGSSSKEDCLAYTDVGTVKVIVGIIVGASLILCICLIIWCLRNYFWRYLIDVSVGFLFRLLGWSKEKEQEEDEDLNERDFDFATKKFVTNSRKIEGVVKAFDPETPTFDPANKAFAPAPKTAEGRKVGVGKGEEAVAVDEMGGMKELKKVARKIFEEKLDQELEKPGKKAQWLLDKLKVTPQHRNKARELLQALREDGKDHVCLTREELQQLVTEMSESRSPPRRNSIIEPPAQETNLTSTQDLDPCIVACKRSREAAQVSRIPRAVADVSTHGLERATKTMPELSIRPQFQQWPAKPWCTVESQKVTPVCEKAELSLVYRPPRCTTICEAPKLEFSRSESKKNTEVQEVAPRYSATELQASCDDSYGRQRMCLRSAAADDEAKASGGQHRHAPATVPNRTFAPLVSRQTDW